MTDQAVDTVTVASRLVGHPLRLVSRLAGGEHAETLLVASDGGEFVVRRFPHGDGAVAREVEVLPRLGGLGELAPRLVAASDDLACPVVVTTRVLGGHPSADLSPEVIAPQMAEALARIHRLDGAGLRLEPSAPARGDGPAATVARREWSRLAMDERVLTHYDFWCGNALWTGHRLTGVVDWSGARQAPRGVDLAWCRLDLVLLGSEVAADLFLSAYEERSRVRVPGISAWDLQAAAQAEDVVEEWAPNYLAIGRAELTPARLRQRLSTWIERLIL